MTRIKLILGAITVLAALALPAAAPAKTRDRDRDRMSDRWERSHHLNVGQRDGARDPDSDGLSNLGEFRARTNPHRADSDRDRIGDGDEDRDRDGVDNANEMREGTGPCDRDSDDDGRGDGAEDRDRDGLDNAGEDATANDPIDADTDDDGIRDGAERAGTIASFTNGLLTITLADGSTVSGHVGPGTEITCQTEDEHEHGEHHHGGHAGAASEGSGERGDDGDDDDGDGDHGGGDDGDDDNVCGAADLVAGVAVHEADLELTAGGATFEEIELLK